VHGGSVGRDWPGWAVRWGWCRALSPGVRSLALVARCSGSKPRGFSACVCDRARVEATTAGQRARRECHGVVRMVPCLCVCGAARERACACQNADADLGAQRSSVESSGRG
jgi:hypothetical protein